MDNNNHTPHFSWMDKKDVKQVVEMLDFHITHSTWDLSQNLVWVLFTTSSWVVVVLVNCWRDLLLQNYLLEFCQNLYLVEEMHLCISTQTHPFRWPCPPDAHHRKMAEDCCAGGRPLFAERCENCLSILGPRLDAFWTILSPKCFPLRLRAESQL